MNSSLRHALRALRDPELVHGAGPEHDQAVRGQDARPVRRYAALLACLRQG